MGRGLILLLVLLAVSISANIFTLGYHSGRMIKAHKSPEIHAPILDRRHHGRLMRHAGALPEESRAVFRAVIEEKLPQLRRHQKEIHKLRAELGAIMDRPDWDRESIRKQMAALEAEHQRQRAAFNEALLDAMAALPPEDRKKLLEHTRRDELRRFEKRKFRGRNKDQ